MKYKVYENCSSVGGHGLLIFELIMSMMYLDFILKRGTNLHSGICLVIEIVVGIIIYGIFNISRIACVIISIAYSTVWFFAVRDITNEFSHGDKTWMLITGIIAFLISLGIHLSSLCYSDYDDCTIIERID